MAETFIDPITAPGLWSETGEQLEMTALDNVNGNQFVCTDHIVAIVHNTDASSQAVRFTSQPHSVTGRTGDINQSIPAGAIWMFRFTQDGWSVDPNGGGCVFMPAGQNANLKIAVVHM